MSDLRSLLAAATPGPWASEGTTVVTADETVRYVCEITGAASNPSSLADAALIVAAINSLPALLDVAEAAKEAVRVYDATEAGEDMASVGDALDSLDSALARLVDRAAG